MTISGGGLSGVFHVGTGVTATLSLLTITNGYESGASGDGGGIYNEGKSLTLNDCTISANTAGNNGGGLDNVGTANVTLNDCTISGNTANNNGGGLNNDSTAKQALALTSCTISGNAADDLGGGLYNNGAVTLNDTIVAGNTKPGSPGDIHNNGTVSGSNNLIGTGFASGVISPGSNNIILTSLSSLGLAALASYGGPTETMALLPGSKAIDAGSNKISGLTIASTDERGFPLDSSVDIGAFQTQPGLVVNTTLDGTNAPSGDLSLRQAVNIANAPGAPDAGADEPITFDTTVFAKLQTITLTQGQLELSNTTVAAETIKGPAAGVTISGGGQSRVFQVDSGVTATVSGLTITGGNAVDDGGNGGGLYNDGTTNLTDCTVSGNSANSGGGLYTQGKSLNLTDCTISANTASGSGGGLSNSSKSNQGLVLTACTVSGNSAQVFGGGLYNNGATTLTDTIIADNTKPGSASDIHNNGTMSGSYNLIGTGFTSGVISPGSNNIILTSLSSMGLAPLGSYGGPTQTMALLPGSAAIGKGTATAAASDDERGLSLGARPNRTSGCLQSRGSR